MRRHLALPLAVEGCSRWLRPTPTPDPLVIAEDPSWSGYFMFDPLLFWRLRPGTEFHGAPVNSLGLHGSEIFPKAEDEFRILSLGESTTFGFGVASDANYSAVLEARLPRVDGKRVRVVNAGSPGYSLFQGVTYLEHRGLALEPDAVLAYFGFNDFLPITYRTKREVGIGIKSTGLTDRERFETLRSVRYRVGGFLLQHSNLFRLVRAGDSLTRADVKPDHRRVRVPAGDRLEFLTRLRELCEERGIRLILVIPWYERFEKHAALMREFAAEFSVPTVDLPERLSHLPLPPAAYFVDRVHPNEIGHRYIGQVIASALRELWDAG
jgi:lysophospholipase L1-like esterase